MQDNLTDTPLLPRKGDQLFRGDLPDRRNNAFVNERTDGDALAYIEGYRRGAELLVRYVVEHHGDQDFLVYPIIFLYRHHIELLLKRIIELAPLALERPLTDDEKTHLVTSHQLGELWRDAEPIMKEIAVRGGWNHLDSATLEGITDYIRQHSKFDPGSYSFRYWHTTKGKRSLSEDLKQINLRHFADMMERLAFSLGGIDDVVGLILDFRAEMAEYIGYE